MEHMQIHHCLNSLEYSTFLRAHVTLRSSFEFMEHYLTRFLDVIHAPERHSCTWCYSCSCHSCTILQHDGAPAHSSNPVRDFLTEKYPRWIDHRGPMPWSPRLHDLNTLDLFIRRCLKQEIYRAEVSSLQNLTSQINEALELLLTATVI